MSAAKALEGDPQALVTLLYRVCLQREPDAAGLLGHALALQSGHLTAQDLLKAFISSEEFSIVNKTAPAHLHVDAAGCTFVIPFDAGVKAELTSPEGYEPWVLPYFLECCRPGMTVFDIGASWGFFALPAARQVGAQGVVYALEVSPQNCKVLAKSIEASNISNIKILPFGLSDRLGSEFLERQSVSNNNFLGADIKVEGRQMDAYDVVPVITLDMIRHGLGPIDIVKMDIEGMECRAIKGGLSFFHEQKPILFLEYSPEFQRVGSGAEGDELLSVLYDMGYKVEILHRHSERQVISEAYKSDAINIINAAWRRHVADDQGTHLDLCFRHPNRRV